MTKKRILSKDEKMQIYAKYNGKCAICGKHIRFNSMTADHIIPLSKGGTDKTENLQLSCKQCNQFKDNYMPLEFFKRNWALLWRSCAMAIKFHAKQVFGTDTKDKGDVVA